MIQEAPNPELLKAKLFCSKYLRILSNFFKNNKEIPVDLQLEYKKLQAPQENIGYYRQIIAFYEKVEDKIKSSTKA